MKKTEIKKAALRQAYFFTLLQSANIPEPKTEYRFHPLRKWRFDFAWPESKLALEIDGGIWFGGRHTHGAGWLKDQEKLNTAQAMGWRILHRTPSNMNDCETISLILDALKWRAMEVI